MIQFELRIQAAMAFVLWLGLIAGSVIMHYATDLTWNEVEERSFFQGVAIATYWTSNALLAWKSQ